MVMDATFGEKLRLMERAIGFQFPAASFTNDAFAALLSTSAETMSRKKSGRARVYDRDISVLTYQFGLGRHGFKAAMFYEPLAQFGEHMDRVEECALSEDTVDVARKVLFDRAREQNGTIGFEVRSTHRGGIGTAHPRPSIPQFTINDVVALRITVPGDGHLIVVNDDRRGPVTMLMPSQFAPETAVKAGTVQVPTSAELRHFPVAGPAGTAGPPRPGSASRPSTRTRPSWSARSRASSSRRPRWWPRPTVARRPSSTERAV